VDDRQHCRRDAQLEELAPRQHLAPGRLDHLLGQQMRLFELAKRQPDQFLRIRHVQLARKPLCDLLRAGTPIAELPDTRRGRVERVNLFALPVVDTHFIA
jgi:hypothetical protein